MLVKVALWTSLGLVASCPPSYAQSNSPDNFYFYVANTMPPDAFLSLRTAPTAAHGLNVMQMPNGTLLQVLQRRDDGWWYVRVVPSNQEGWALSGQGNRVWIECCVTASTNPPVGQAGQVDTSAELHQCRNATDPADKIEHCSAVIARAKNRSALEVAYNSRGLALEQLQRFAEAANDFSAVINLDPRIAGYYDNRQRAYRGANRLSDALADANTAIRLAPNYSFVYRARGNVYNDMGQYENAISDYNQAIQISPEDGGLFIDRGKILGRMNRPQDAILDFSHALELDSKKWAAAFRERGLAYKLVGQYDKAQADLSVFVQLEPGDGEAAQALRELQTAATAKSTAPTPVIEKDRAERADRVIAAAKWQLDDAAAFIKEHPRSPNLLDYVDRIAALSASVKDGDPDEIERKTTDLANVLSHDKGYQQHLADLAEAQKSREAQFLPDAIHRGQKERDFVLDYIGKNPLADATPTLAALVKQLNPALEHADLNQLQPLLDKIEATIREFNLESAFIAAEAKNSPEKKTDTAAATTQVPTDELPTTEKNRFLMEGDLDDVEILYNANSKAPHVAQNLRGDFVFSQNQARVCLFGQGLDGLALTVKQMILAKANPRQIAITVEPCDPEQLLSYDMVVAQRNAFLRSKRDDALALIKTIENDDYRRFAEVKAADMSKAADADRAQIAKIKANIADGAPDGFGVVLLKTGSPNLCLAVAAKVPSHRQLLLRAEDKLNLEMQTEVVIKDTTVDDAFINIQKHQCGAVYASAADLKTLTAALARNDIPYAFSSLWNLPSDVEGEDAALAEKARLAAQEETERAQRNADQSRLASVRAEDLSATQAAQQVALRQKFGDSAKAAADALSSEIAALTKDPSGSIAGFYPAYEAWLTEKLADHWEITTIDTGVQDFGLSTFKSRGLDTIFARITLHLKNRMLGEYKDACFIFGRINDTEFSMSREPAFAKCDDEAAIMSWQTGHEFKSEWLASN